ncbi:CGNR zinc finger domain-containing protein [Actinacidiphila sp. bgisy167]|uniref:CGNR zinc finger domain-containing protein n=1 Tax=Actinacidiphila sp. bgisy167 TaxID=3413797 RepID=UPI003D72E6CA
MADDTADDDLLLELLNTTPVADGTQVDELADPEAGRRWLRAHGGSGTAQELRHLLEARDALQRVVRGDGQPADLQKLLAGVARTPRVAPHGIDWVLEAPSDRVPAVRAVTAWGVLQESRPGRLRPCANDECRLFLLDRSKANTARWCSMAACGNRMKARRHHRRARAAAAG